MKYCCKLSEKNTVYLNKAIIAWRMGTQLQPKHKQGNFNFNYCPWCGEKKEKNEDTEQK